MVASPQTDEDGIRILKDQYRLEDKIGEGGPSIVYRGTDILLHLPVAIKQLKKDGVGGLIDSRRFLREARTQAKLVHQNIIAIRAIIEEDGEYFIVMEYIDGETLEKCVPSSPQQPKLSPTQFVDYGCQILGGLGHAHQKGVLHRDIKPPNIMLAKDGIIKLADFGIARAFQDNRLTQTGAILGTPAYMSPEQISSQDLDHRTDIYSLGVLLYELACGFTPFRHPKMPKPDLFEIMRRHLMENIISPIDSGADIPPRLNAVICKALERDPADRFQDCDIFERALLQSLRVAPVEQIQAPTPSSDTIQVNHALSSGVGVTPDLPTQDDAQAGDSQPKPPPRPEGSASPPASGLFQTTISPAARWSGRQVKSLARASWEYWKAAGAQKRTIIVISFVGGASLLLNLFFLFRSPKPGITPPPRLAANQHRTQPRTMTNPPVIGRRQGHTNTQAPPSRRAAYYIRVLPPRPATARRQRLLRTPPFPTRPPDPPPPAHNRSTTLAPGTRVKWRDQMIEIPAGCFTQGIAQPQKGANDAVPARKVCLDTFLIDTFEVSVAQYQQCIEEKGCKQLWQKHWFKWRDVASRLPKDNPIAYTYWQDAVRFCKWAGKRLPTEAEWEKAARGTNQRPYPWGGRSPTCRHARYRRCRSKDTIGPGIRTQGRSAYGLYDMAGSVWEWVQDCYQKDAYRLLPERNPVFRKRRCGKHVIRGGSRYSRNTSELQTFTRESAGGRRRRYDYGFRCAWSKHKP